MYTIVEQRAGVDWLSATLPIDNDTSAHWKRACMAQLERIARDGNKVVERSLLGFTGHSVGNCFMGSNLTHTFAQFTGHHANDVFDSIYRHDLHISRIDMQVSVTFDKMPLTLARKAYADANSQNETIPKHRRRKVNLIIGSDYGDTLYIGSPSSDQRARLYNKEVQSAVPEYERTWRYECVLKNDYATEVCHSLYRERVRHLAYIASFCAAFFEKRGVTAPWAFQDEEDLLPIIKTLPTDVEKKLTWLASQVAPTIRYLCEAGYRDTILALLPELTVSETV